MLVLSKDLVVAAADEVVVVDEEVVEEAVEEEVVEEEVVAVGVVTIAPLATMDTPVMAATLALTMDHHQAAMEVRKIQQPLLLSIRMAEPVTIPTKQRRLVDNSNNRCNTKLTLHRWLHICLKQHQLVLIRQALSKCLNSSTLLSP